MLVLETNEEQEALSFHRQLISWWADLWARLRHKPAVKAQDEKKTKQGPRSLIL